MAKQALELSDQELEEQQALFAENNDIVAGDDEYDEEIDQLITAASIGVDQGAADTADGEAGGDSGSGSGDEDAAQEQPVEEQDAAKKDESSEHQDGEQEPDEVPDVKPAPSLGTLLSRAVSEHEDDTDDDLDQAIIDAKDQEQSETCQDDDLELPDDEPEVTTESYAPPLINPASTLDDDASIDELLRAEGGPQAGPQSQQWGNESEYVPGEEPQKATATGMVAGAAAGLFSRGAQKIFSFRNRSQEAYQKKMLEKYERQEEQFANLVDQTMSHASMLGQTKTGMIGRDLIDRYGEAPASVMANAFKGDAEAKGIWANLTASMDGLRESAKQLQKSAYAAGLNPETIQADIMQSVNGLSADIETQLNGMVDENQRPMQAAIRSITDRIEKLVQRVVESLNAVLGRSESTMSPGQ